MVFFRAILISKRRPESKLCDCTMPEMYSVSHNSFHFHLMRACVCMCVLTNCPHKIRKHNSKKDIYSINNPSIGNKRFGRLLYYDFHVSINKKLKKIKELRAHFPLDAPEKKEPFHFYRRYFVASIPKNDMLYILCAVLIIVLVLFFSSHSVILVIGIGRGYI